MNERSFSYITFQLFPFKVVYNFQLEKKKKIRSVDFCANIHQIQTSAFSFFFFFNMSLPSALQQLSEQHNTAGIRKKKKKREMLMTGQARSFPAFPLSFRAFLGLSF